jgi:hypothetical protein
MIASRQRRFGVLCVLGYVMLSWSVRSDMRRGDHIASLVYPLDTFSMYARVPGGEMSLLLVRDARGTVHQVTAFRRFDCDEPVVSSTGRCADRHRIAYHDEDLTRYIREHAGPGDTEVDVVLRSWQVRPGSSPVHESDCVIAHCRVSR